MRHRTPDLVVAVLGVLRAGAVCLVRHPGGSAGDLGALPAPAFTMAAEDLRAAMAEAPSTVDTRLPPRPGSAAVVVTNADRDRWVVLTHDNLVGTVSAVQAALGLGADTAYLVGAPDTTVLDMMATLCAGGRAVLADGAGRGTRVAELIAAGQVTTVRAAADTWREVAATGHPLAGLTAVSTGAL